MMKFTFRTLYNVNRPFTLRPSNIIGLGLYYESGIFPTSIKYNQLSTTNRDMELSDSSAKTKVSPTGSRSDYKLIKDLHNEWLVQFQKNNITDPELSIQYIIEHILNSHQVKPP